MNARAGILMALLLAGPASAAEDKGRASDRALAPLVVCRPIPDPRLRAACYDAALDKLQQSVADRNVVVMDREQVKQDFGFGGGPPPKRIANARSIEPITVQEMASTIASVAPYSYGMWVVRLANGAIWRTSDSMDSSPRTGAEVHVRRGALGSYVMFIGKSQSVRVKRVK